ncbi:DUF4129 domain-containing protein [Halalkalibacterium halodurans]|uniref:DUF4129 domain-containing protein n=1 Tax=Halalkalibacterium halodurans TaxID=86665 RepID=UPI002E1F372B|nr:DUF4129 domain-containing protein [Halalkalibacterium halodurans]
MKETSIQADRETLEEILSREEYTAYTRERMPNPVLEWIQGVLKKMEDLFPEISVSPGTSISSASLVLILLLILLAGVIAWLTYKLVSARIRRTYAVYLSDREMEQTVDALLQKADTFASEHNYFEAIRYSFLALLKGLDDREWIRAEKWKTNFEYAEELSFHQPEAVLPFRQAARLFERVYYGRGTYGKQEYEQMIQMVAPYVRKEGEANEK